MERFVKFVVGGGLLLVAGLWGAEVAAPQAPTWLLSVAVAALGCVAVLTGIWLELDLAA
jgi:hypothetical protein